MFGMNYLRKMEMYALLCSVVDENTIDSARYCVYQSNGETEWLYCYSLSGEVKYRLYARSNDIYLNVYGYDDDVCDYVKDINRISYHLEKGQLVELYRRYPENIAN